MKAFSVNGAGNSGIYLRMHATLRLLAVCLALIVPVSGAMAASDQAIKDAIVKIYTIHNSPDYYNPWSMRGPAASTGSGCVVKGKRILTNAHVVSDRTYVQVRRNGEAKRHEAKVLWVSHEADLALLTVADESFFEGIEPLDLGELPDSQQEVLVYGFPLGGDTLSTTKGVISRLEHQVYVHSSCYLFAGQIDAAINPGNSGGPVLEDGKIAGVVMQSMSQADNIGYMVPVNVVRHFFDDIADGSSDGFPSLGVAMQDMQSDDLKRMSKMPKDETGMLIYRIVPGSPAEGHLNVGDVLTHVDGNNVADDGTVEFRPKERTAVAFHIQKYQVGDDLKLRVLRDGQPMEMSLKLDRPMWHDWLVPQERYDVMPTYYIFGGVVFVPLTKNYIEQWGPNWWQNAPDTLTVFLSENFPEKEGEEVVLALKVLPSDINEGYHSVANWVIDEVNGKPISNLKELIASVESSSDPFVTFSGGTGQKLVLDREKAVGGKDAILKTYRVLADRSPDLLP